MEAAGRQLAKRAGTAALPKDAGPSGDGARLLSLAALQRSRR